MNQEIKIRIDKPGEIIFVLEPITNQELARYRATATRQLSTSAAIKRDVKRHIASGGKLADYDWYW